MSSTTILDIYKIPLFVFFLLMGYTGVAQIAKVEIIGGATISSGSSTTITAGTSLNFRITNS